MSKQALLIIDVQNDYFPGGKWTLHNIDAAAANVQKLLASARDQGTPVFHVHHEAASAEAPFFAPGTEGAEIHDSVRPVDGEQTVLKHQVNAFRDTDLQQRLDDAGVTDLTVVGAMSHMCIDSAVRAATDLGYRVTVIEDACASRDLELEQQTVAAPQVHAAFIAALGSAFATVTTTRDYLGED